MRIHAPQSLKESGLLQYILPRFSLKHQIVARLVGNPTDADAVFGSQGTPLFSGLGQTWHLTVRNADYGPSQRFADWMSAEIGLKTVMAYAPDGSALFGPVAQSRAEQFEPEMTGDPVLGRAVAREKCIRCHVIDADTRHSGIGSTPSFSALRGLPNWGDRIASFYALNPHPSFTVVPGVTPPFDAARPPPITPVVITTTELEAILAFVGGLQPADLGKALQHQ